MEQSILGDATKTVTAISLMHPLEALVFSQFQLAALLYQKTEAPQDDILKVSIQILEIMKMNALGRKSDDK